MKPLELCSRRAQKLALRSAPHTVSFPLHSCCHRVPLINVIQTPTLVFEYIYKTLELVAQSEISLRITLRLESL